MADNLRHAQYRDDGTQIDDPQKIVDDGSGGEGGISSDANNALVLGSDDKPYLDEDNLIAADEVADLAVLLALTGVPDGRAYTVLAPVISGASGLPGTRWNRDSSSPSGWRPAGRQVLAMLRTPVDGVSGGTTAEQFLWSPQMPAPLLAGINALILESRMTASGTDAASRTIRWRCGSAGTTSDAELANFLASSAARVMLMPQHASTSGNTTLLPTHFRTSAVSPDAALATGSTPQTVTVPDMSSAGLYISLTVQQGASPTQTITAERAWLIVE